MLRKKYAISPLSRSRNTSLPSAPPCEEGPDHPTKMSMLSRQSVDLSTDEGVSLGEVVIVEDGDGERDGDGVLIRRTPSMVVPTLSVPEDGGVSLVVKTGARVLLRPGDGERMDLTGRAPSTVVVSWWDG